MIKLKIMLYFFCLVSTATIAQDENGKLIFDENTTIAKFGFTETGSFYVLEHVKQTNYKTRYRVWDKDFKPLETLTFENKIDGFEFLFPSTDGSSFLYEDNNYNPVFGGKKKIDFKDVTSKEFEFYHQFMTKSKFVGLGQRVLGKKIKFSWNTMVESKKVFEETFVIVSKNLDNGKQDVFELENIQGCFLNPITTKTLYFDEDVFIISFLTDIKTKLDREKRSYTVVTYNYTGKVIQKVELQIGVEDSQNDKFAVVNLENGSFDTYVTNNRTGFGNSLGTIDVDTQSFANANSMGNVKYDHTDKSFYTYAGILPIKGDSGILIQKFNENGELLWRKQHVLEDTIFNYINSLNRYLSFDMYAPFIGISVNSTKGKNYCDFYILNKDSGEIMAFEKFDNYGFFGKSKNYNGLDVEYEIKNEEYINLGLDRSIIYAALYNKDFKEFLLALNNKGPHLITGHYTEENLVTIISGKKDYMITFDKFKFK